MACFCLKKWMFLCPDHRDKAFEITPLSVDLFWEKLTSTPQFYFSPVGLFATQALLFVMYLILFAYLGSERQRVYDDFTPTEYVFWLCNLGFVFNELMQLIDAGISGYFDQWVCLSVCVLFCMCNM